MNLQNEYYIQNIVVGWLKWEVPSRMQQFPLAHQ